MSSSKTSPPQRSRRRRVLKTGLGIVVSLLCLGWVVSSVEQESFLAALRNADIVFVLAALLTTLYSYVLRAWRWPFFFGRQAPGFYDSFRCLIIGFFMNNVLPARMGEVVRAYLGGKATKQSGTIVLATVAAERLADGLVISLLFAIFFSFSSHPDEIARAKEIYFVAYLFLAATLLTFLVLLVRQRIFTFLEHLGEIMPGHLSSYTLIRVKRFILGLEPLLRPSRLLILGAFSLAVWLIELLVYYEVAVAFGQEMTLGALSLFLAAVNFSSLIPAAPGGIGVIEALATFALVRIGVDKETALAMVVTQHLIQYLVVGAPGTFFFLFHLGGRFVDAAAVEELEQEEEAPDMMMADVSQARPALINQPLSFEQRTMAADALSTAVPVAFDFSIIIPAFNEESRLPKTLLAVLEYTKKRPESFEILVVDDGSSDNTAKVALQFSELSPEVKLLTYPNNRGKGYAVKFGVTNARGRIILFDDADGATPIEEIERLEEAVLGGAQIAIGSRAMFSKHTAVETVWYRKYIGRIYNGIVNMLILPGIADTQCGFKMFVGPAARSIFSRTFSERFAFDVEVLFLARKLGLKIVEVPVNWTNIPGSKVNLARDSLAMFVDILKVRLRDAFGAYGRISHEDFLKESRP